MPCKFKSICNKYSDTSATCQESGGRYCGMHRYINEQIQNRKAY